MTIVHIWERYDLTGHASVGKVDDYASFHPKNYSLANNIRELVGRSVPKRWTDYETDKKTYGRPCNTIEVHGLNETAVEHCIISMIEDSEQSGDEFYNYNLHSHNCSTVVAHVLAVGLAMHKKEHFYTAMLDKLKNEDWTTVTTPFRTAPEHSVRYIETLFDLFERVAIARLHLSRGALRLPPGKLPKFALGFMLGLDAHKRASVWTPGEVLRLANGINKHADQLQ